MTERVIWFTDNSSPRCVLENDSVSRILLPTQKPGRLGRGIAVVSLPSITITVAITGLSSARS